MYIDTFLLIEPVALSDDPRGAIFLVPDKWLFSDSPKRTYYFQHATQIDNLPNKQKGHHITIY